MARQSTTCVPQWTVVNSARRNRHHIARSSGIGFAAALVLACCSGSTSSTWCDDATTLTDVVSRYRGAVDFPDPTQLRRDVASAIGARDRAASDATEAVADAFETMGLAVVDLDRVLDGYGYDLLRAQSESDSAEQDELFAIEGQPVTDALATGLAEIARRCDG